MLSSREFRLFAPRIERVQLTGSFNDWNEIEMVKNNLTGQFTTKIDLPEGEVRYRFRVPSPANPTKMIDILDPYATRVEMDGSCAIITTNRDEEYQWKHEGKILPENEDLIIYELFLADLTPEGTLNAAKQKLDYLADDLGINCIELMPIQACLLGHDWGYTTKHFFALEPSYGSAEDLKDFVDQCHARGIRVMLDVVFNHSHTDCPLNQIDPSYWYYDGMHHPAHPDEVWGPEFNYEFQDEQHGGIRPALTFISDVIRFWIEEFHIDGMRFDAAKQIDNSEVLSHFDAIGHSLRSPFYTVAEYVPATSTIVKPRGPVDGVWRNVVPPFQDHFQFPENISLLERLLLSGEPQKEDQYLYAISTVNFWACHDNERFLSLLHRIRLCDDEAFRRLEIAATWLMTAVGVPLIWMGDEWGEDRVLGDEDRTKKVNKLDWSALTKTSQSALLHRYRRLISLRKSSSAIKSNNIDFFHQDLSQPIIAYRRWSDETDELVVVVFNFSIKDQRGYRLVDWPKNGRWHEALDQTELVIIDHQLEIDLTSYQAKVFVWKGRETN